MCGPPPGGRAISSRPEAAAGRRDPGLAMQAAAARALPVVALVVFVTGVAVTLAVAGNTLGYDFLAYHGAVTRLLGGRDAYDMSYQAAGGFGLFFYPPTFIPFVLGFGLL